MNNLKPYVGVYCEIDRELYTEFKSKYKKNTKIINFLSEILEKEIKKLLEKKEN